MKALGCLGLLGTITPLGPVYFLIMLFKGREMAWQNRTYASVEQYRSTMRVWNGWGVFCFTVLVLLVLALFMFSHIFSQIISQVVGGIFGDIFGGVTKVLE